ncbi:MAG TPA: 2-dehydropantoate 2-reductase [Burkholderiaceae bacterium]|nr:2-dehydropantoate 2-reductase [Burkholderiaceae bacterium]
MAESASPQKVCIVGAGAIGGLIAGWIAHRLPAAEAEVSVLARGETLTALRERGLRIDEASAPEAAPIVVHPRAESDPAALGVQDVVIVAVKAPALAAVAPAVSQLIGARTQVVVAMNGVPWWFFDGQSGPCQGLRLASVDAGDAVRAALPSRHVIGCVVHMGCSTLGAAHLRHGMGNGLILGDPFGAARAAGDASAPALSGPDDPQSPERLAALADLLQRAGFAASVSPQIQREVWFKLWGNMSMNPISVLTRATLDRILDEPLTRAWASSLMREAQALGNAFGCPIDQDPEERHLMTRKIGAFKTSMLQDYEAGRPMEIDALVGAVSEIGRHLGLPTPNIDALLGLVRLADRSRG